MAGYLDEYGVSDARRAKGIKRIILVAAALALAGVAIWFFSRDYSEGRRADRFLSLVRKGDLRSAYLAFGCPCKEYTFEAFNEHWGPAGDHGDMSQARIEKSFMQRFSQSCGDGVIYTVVFARGDPVNLFVLRSPQIMSTVPWTSCAAAGRVNTTLE